MAQAKGVGDKYRQHDLRSHIYELPDTWAGSSELTTIETFIYNPDDRKMVKKDITYVPALYKCFDEILVNALDQATRLKAEQANGKTGINHLKTIKVKVDKASGYVEVSNDGDGIEVEKHPELGVYIPEMIFGRLLTSANYDKEEEKVVGGKNGVGAKLTNIFSKEFKIETVDHRHGKIYTQRWFDNMKGRDSPSVKSSSKTPYTKITFLPDYVRFGLPGMTDDMFELIRKRTMDACACTDSHVSVYFNDEKIPYKTFESYVDLYLGAKDEHPRVYEACNERWEVVATYSETARFEQVSFVNGINTLRGGKHVEQITNQICKELAEMVSKKKKKEVKPQHIRDNLMVFVKSLIVNPSFDSQSKETLTTQVSKFGSKCDLSDKFFDKLYKTGITDKAVSLTEFHENKKLAKTDGKKTSRVLVPKLDDANKAGTRDSADCTLILTEGLSAKTMAIAGLSVVGRDKYGVFPLKGKILNVKDALTAKISANEEIANLKKILGLEQGKEYSDLSSLRYGRIMIMTDQDSVTEDTPLLLRDPMTKIIDIRTIDDIADGVWDKPVNCEKEYNTTPFEVWTEKGWTKIKHVMRHKVQKKIYRVLTHNGVVDVTEDHSLLDKNAQKLSPKECNIGTELLHNFPRAYPVSPSSLVKEDDAYDMGKCWGKKCSEPFNDNEKCKKVPLDILNATHVVREAFFNGFTDGCINFQTNEHGNFIFDVVGKIGAMGMYYICKSLGYKVSIDNQANKPKAYTLNITRKNDQQQGNPNVVKKMYDMGTTERYVYDLETDNHHFHAGVGQMIVHNTDGFHIRGLLFNVFQSLWPSLYKHEGFLVSMMTPIVKAFNSSTKESRAFYNLSDFERWKQATDQRGWKLKYYKGLGTSTEDEAKDYFRDMNVLKYVYNGKESDEALDLAFNKKRADDRKDWLMHFNRDIVLDYAKKDVPYEEFVHKELIHFSNRDLERSINHLCDGLKESTRKIIFTCLKRKIYNQEIRVAQLAGSVSELSAYHHGEASLQQAIVGLAQIFVGANNINLLMPNGQFGTRIQGGADAASPRYIHTLLSQLARKIFREDDIPVLKHLDDDGVPIEPEFYIPIIPMILVNGGLGIGTGFSTNVPSHNPNDIIDLCMRTIAALDEAVGMIENSDGLSRAYDAVLSVPLPDLQPWYLGFKGTIIPNKETSFASKGVYRWVDDQTVEITELPIGIWTEDYKDFLTSMIAGGSNVLKDFESHYTAKTVKFILKLYPGARAAVERNFETEFKLVSTKNLSTNNIHLYGADGAIRKYTTILEVFREWVCIRIAKYVERKHHQLKSMEHEFKIVSAKVRFIQDIIDNKIKVMNKKQAEVEEQLRAHGYPQLHDVSEDGDMGTKSNYLYLIRMPIYQLTFEKKQALEREADKLNTQIRSLKAKPVQHIWKEELQELQTAWDAHKTTIDAEYEADKAGAATQGAKKRGVTKKKA
jgi:DNA gyrase/topoisomerase IV subunit B